MVAPGPTAFTVIPYCASSMARQRVKWSTAAFDTQYAPISQRGTLAAVEAVLTMRPPRASIIDGTTAWQQKSMLLRFTSSTRRQAAASTSTMDMEGKAMPALFTRTWTGPYVWRTAATSASTDARWLTSAANAAARPPARRIACDRLLRVALIDVGHRHLRALPRERLGGGAADARAGARDQDRPVGPRHRVASLRAGEQWRTVSMSPPSARACRAASDSDPVRVIGGRRSLPHLN